MNKSKKKKDSNVLSLYESILICGVIISIVLSVVAFVLVIIYSEGHWLIHETFQIYMVGSIFLGIGFVALLPREESKRIGKIVANGFGIIMMILAIYTVTDGTKLLLDKKYFDKQEYETTTGVAEERKMASSRRGPSHISMIKVDGELYHNNRILQLSVEEFDENMLGKEIRLYYLPYSKRIIKWEYP